MIQPRDVVSSYTLVLSAMRAKLDELSTRLEAANPTKEQKHG